jgi:hypothetical protein
MSNAPAISTSWQHPQVGKTETVEQLIRRAHNAQAASAEKLSASKISRIIRKYVAAHGIESAAAMVDAYCLTYADPVGETAVRNVMAVTK